MGPQGSRDGKEQIDAIDTKIFLIRVENDGIQDDYQICTLSVKLDTNVIKAAKTTEGITSLKIGICLVTM